MNARSGRTLTGPFRATRLAADAWRLTTDAAHSPEIFLSGVDRDAAAALEGATPGAVSVAWSGNGAVVTLLSSVASVEFDARAATIHEPRPQLYAALPLVSLDESARRFWRRVFWIARIPGGRRLLRFIAQRTRGG